MIKSVLRFLAVMIYVLLFTGVGVLVFSQETGQKEAINYNTFYQFPFSVGVNYQSLSPLSDYGEDYAINDISFFALYPLPKLPLIQPFIQAGAVRFDSRDRDNPDKWDHTHWYGLAGAAYMNRFSKNFELGADLSAGFSEAIFKNLDPEAKRGAFGLIVSLGGNVALNPSYNMSINVRPSFKYIRSFSPLTKFNGFLFGIGFSGSYRFGKDPDSPQAIIRSIRFDQGSIQPLFAAMQSYYVKNPIGQVTISNVEDFSITDINVSFFQAGFMDNPTKAVSIPQLKQGEQVQVDLLASFNQEVFTTEGITPLTGEVIVDYITRNKAATQTYSISYDLHDKTALTWDDDRKVGAFITPADSALRNYTSFIRQATKNDVVPGLSEPLQISMQIFSALTELGTMYQIDPTSPFTAAQENPVVVDSVSFARNTLKRLTGDCDDLTVLFSSLLETVGIETAYITLPGHIYAAFNTRVPARDYRKVHPDKNMTINVDGELWVPVEITLIGSDDFMSAWRLGIEEYAALDSAPEKRQFIFTAKAQEIYRPVSLKEADLGLQYGVPDRIVSDFNKNIDKLVDTIIADYANEAEETGEKRGYNQLGIVAAQYGRYDQAEEAFQTALSIDKNYLTPKINLGNVYYMRQEYQEALRNFHSAERYLAESGRESSGTFLKVLLNISRSYYELENYEKATQYYDRMVALDPEKADRFSYLAGSSNGGRSADARLLDAIQYVDEEDDTGREQ